MTCQKCGSPVTPGTKFCESCGAKIDAGPACPHCGALLMPDAKFCESCGKLVAAAPAAPVETPPAAEKTPPVTPAVTPAPETPAPVQEGTQPDAKPEPVPEMKPSAPPLQTAAVPVKEAHQPPGPKKPVPQTTMIIAVVIVLALLGAAGYFVVLPMLSGPATSQGPSGQTAMPTAAAGSSATSGSSTAGSGTVSLTAGPTQVLPNNRGLILDVERNAITSVITVTFQGGEGQYGVRELVVTLTTSDGKVETKTFKPEYRGTSISIQGSDKENRVEVTANFYNGETYKVVDKVFEYKKRVGSS